MTNREYYNQTVSALEDLRDLLFSIEGYSCFKNDKDIPDYIERVLSVLPSRETVERAISDIRHSFVNKYKNYLFRSFCSFESHTWDFTQDMTYTCDYAKVAVRKFFDDWYIVKILNPDEYHRGILQTESPDDFMFHSLPYKRYMYPELAMVDFIFDEMTGMADEEMTNF